jgi:hypothetical protein
VGQRLRCGGTLPCPRTAGDAGEPTHDHPSRRRTSSAWIMCGGKMGSRGSTRPDHSVYVVGYAASDFAGSASTPRRTVCDVFSSRTRARGPHAKRSEPGQGQPLSPCRHLSLGRHTLLVTLDPPPRGPRGNAPHPRIVSGFAPPCGLAQALHSPSAAHRVHGCAALRHALAGRSLA